MDQATSGHPVSHLGFEAPYVDIDEERDLPAPHRYIHGGFNGTDTRFSAYFPPAKEYDGRFFQHITPIPDSENLAPTLTGREDKVSFAFSSGAYFLETNGGGQGSSLQQDHDPSISAYRANAAAADYSRVLAAGIYGKHRPFGYAYGGSGGGFRTIGGAENTSGVWDGFVPYVIGSPMALPNVFTVRMHAQRVLRDKFGIIDDAFDAGGNNDPMPALTSEERDALTEVTRMGFPPRSWFGHRTMGSHAFGALFAGLMAMDPDYFSKFWTTPGYLGADPEASIHSDRLQWTSSVAELIRGGSPGRSHGPRGGVDQAFRGAAELAHGQLQAVRLSSKAPINTQNAELVVTSGPATGARVFVEQVDADLVTIDTPDARQLLAGLAPGDTVTIDNSNLLAAQTYHRHQVPGAEYTAWDQYRRPDGSPAYPQRPFIVGPMIAKGASGTLQTGKFDGKMIVVACLLDREAFPWQADWYAGKVREHLGEGFDDRFRLWYVDHGLHGDSGTEEEHPTRSVPYIGVLQEALRQLAAWVERDESPAAGTTYSVADGQVAVPASAEERGGVQAVATLTANSRSRAEVSSGSAVLLRLTADMPPDSGQIVAVEWDLDGDGTYDATETFRPDTRVDLTRTARFTVPGTYFITARVTAQGEGIPESPWARIENLARARIVVS